MLLPEFACIEKDKGVGAAWKRSSIKVRIRISWTGVNGFAPCRPAKTDESHSRLPKQTTVAQMYFCLGAPVVQGEPGYR